MCDPFGVSFTSVTKRRNGRPVDTNGNERRKPAKAHAQASNVSPPTQANKTTKQLLAEHAYPSLNRHPTHKATALASIQDLSHTAQHNPFHLRGANVQAQPGPNPGQNRKGPRVTRQRKSRRRGGPPAPTSMPRYHGAEAQGIIGALWLLGGRRW